MVKKIHGFDYLRAMCCLLVVAWHVSLQNPPTWQNRFLVNSVNIFSYNVALLAVPIFFQISLFLFYQSRNRAKDYFFKKRLPLVLKLYLFWTINIVIFKFLISRTWPQIDSIKSLLKFVITGGDIFWFFFSLIFVTCVAELIARITDKLSPAKSLDLNFTLFIIACISVFLLPLINLLLGKNYNFFTAWWLPFNFTPYVFSSYILAQKYTANKLSLNRKNSVYLGFILIITVVFIVLEWAYFNIPGEWYVTMIPQYSRLSLVFASLLLTWLSLYIDKTPKFIETLSKYSLGIFCIHFFIVDILMRIEKRIWQIPGEDLIIFILTVYLAIVLTKFLKRINLVKGLI